MALGGSGVSGNPKMAQSDFATVLSFLDAVKNDDLHRERIEEYDRRERGIKEELDALKMGNNIGNLYKQAESAKAEALAILAKAKADAASLVAESDAKCAAREATLRRQEDEYRKWSANEALRLHEQQMAVEGKEDSVLHRENLVAAREAELKEAQLIVKETRIALDAKITKLNEAMR